MALVVISIDENKLPRHTMEDFDEWVRFRVGNRADIRTTNPLCECDMTAQVREISSFKGEQHG